MFPSHKRSHFLSRRRSAKARRPQHMSRRQKRGFGFETLEDRRVMSANPLISELGLVSYSSATLPGQLEILARELQNQSNFSPGQQNRYVVNSIPRDPLVPNQWHLINTGQQVGQPNFQSIFGVPGNDINVASVWNQGYTGEGVVVAVVDSGVERLHPDLVANIHPTLQLDALDLDGDANPEVFEFDIDDQIPWLLSSINAHGTSVAGIIAAEADNGLGGTGIAYNSEIVPIRLIDVGQTEQAFIDTFRYRTDEIDITNNSWGPAVVRGLDGPTPDELLALRDSVFFGRDGLGVIHVFAAGNSGLDFDSSGYNGWVNSRYTIGVTAVDHDGAYNNVDGTVTGLPETGASVLVAAYDGSGSGLTVGDDIVVGSGIVTTDTTGNTGFNVSPDPDTGQEFDFDFQPDNDYTSQFGDTSAAAPQVSAVIALMLEANPNLSWRDVQEILVRSSSQVSKFGTQADGLDKVEGLEYQNTWIVNQVPLFHDPDPYDPLIDNTLQLVSPILDPRLSYFESDDEDPFVQFSFPDEKSAHYVPTPHVLTNGAGYTVSQGRGTNNEQTGFAHGVIDAELAVAMAEQWHVKGQNLPDELSFTTAAGFDRRTGLPSAELTNQIDGNGFELIVPGGIGGVPGFAAYWNEYFDPAPDFDPPAIRDLERGTPLEFEVPSPNDMIVETVEIKLEIVGGDAEFLDHVRVVLVSPTGTHSELNHYFVDPSFDTASDLHQPSITQINGLNGVSDDIEDYFDPGSIDTDPLTDLEFNFTTNRNWGERSDTAIMFDPTTAEPIIDSIFGVGGNLYNVTEPTAGDLMTQGWQLHMENYGNVDLTLESFEIIWHGSPIEANTERVQGLIGIDDNRDDLFNYSRVIQQTLSLDLDDSTFRLGEVFNVIDPNHESMGSNITVLAYRDVNGNGQVDEGTDILVDQFLTGADGNFYFDLVPADYVIQLDSESLGNFTAVDDSLTPDGFLPNYLSEWAISEEYFRVWDYDENLAVPLDPVTDAPLMFLDGTDNPVVTGVKHVNFLLDPGAPAAQQATFNGSVIADFNADGQFNGDDIALPGINVFADTNRNGRFDAGEDLTTTDLNGEYTLIVDPIVSTTVLNIGVIAPVDWTTTDPTDGLETFFVGVGDVFNDVDFSLTPPFSSPGDGSGQSGILLGSVFDDINQDSLRQSHEQGLSNVTVYIDGNNSGALEAGETFTTTNSNGAFVFANLNPGNYPVRIDLSTNPELAQTSPFTPIGQTVSAARNISLLGGGTVTDVEFGVFNSAVMDFGDLPAAYGVTSLANDGARHSKGVYFLGSRIDSELDGFPSLNSDGDDLNLDDDEDGVTLAPLNVGDTSTTWEVTASRYGGYLQLWVDWNADNDFDDAMERVFEDRLIPFGTSQLTIPLPSTFALSGIHARFRYGEFGLELTGPALIGEVEDYLVDVTQPIVASINADLNNDGMVGGRDFMAWLRGYGTSSGATPEEGDTNGDGQVDVIDLENLQAEYGTSYVAAAAATAPEEAPPQTSDTVSGSDFLAWMRGFGTTDEATIAEGDKDLDGDVDEADLVVVLEAFGTSGETQQVAASAFSMAANEEVAVVADSETESSGLSDSSSVSQAVDSTRFIGLSGALLAEESSLEGSRTYVAMAARLDKDSEGQELPVGDLYDRGIDPQDQALGALYGPEEELETLEYASGEQEDSQELVESAFSSQTNWRLF